MMNQNLSAQELEQKLKMVVKLSRIVSEELGRTGHLLEKGYFGYRNKFRQSDVVELLNVMESNSLMLESIIGDVVDIDYPWKQETEDGTVVDVDQVSGKWFSVMLEGYGS